MWQVMTVSLKAKRTVFAPTDGVLDICKDDSTRRLRGIDFSRPVGLISLVSGLPFRKSAVRAVDAQLLGASAEAVTLKGIIPACAGNINVVDIVAANERDHPRVCGEHSGLLPQR